MNASTPLPLLPRLLTAADIADYTEINQDILAWHRDHRAECWECMNEVDHEPQRAQATLDELARRAPNSTGPNAAAVQAATAAPERAPQAGARAANQFGTFQVHGASEAQVRFIKRLAVERDLSRLGEIAAQTVAKGVAQANDGTINKKMASRTIEFLLGCAEKPESARPVARATDKQVGLINRLMAERDVANLPHVLTDESIAALTPSQASGVIDALFQAPKRVTAPAAELEPGIYRTSDGAIYKVYKGQSGRMLAKELVVGKPGQATFEYRGLASRFATADQRMTLEQAKAFGAIYGVCCNCGATLTDENSIEAGIGPVCAKRFA